MTIQLDQISKQYSRQTVIHKFSYQFESGQSYAIHGHNGSGKSTLLQLLAGSISPNKGSILYTLDNATIPVEVLYQHISLAAPYMDLIEDMSMEEIVAFHFSFKDSIVDEPLEKINQLLGYDLSKLIKHYSSGMKQRLKLLLALFTASNILFLDEPTANLDDEGSAWYRDLVLRHQGNRTLIIASAQHHDHDFCAFKISMTELAP